MKYAHSVSPMMWFVSHPPTTKSSTSNIPLAKRSPMVYLACVWSLVDLVSIIKNETNPKSAKIPVIRPSATSILKLIILTKGLRTQSKKRFKKN